MIIKVLAVMLMSTCSLLANTATQRSAFSLISRSDQHMDIRFTLPAYELNNQRHQGEDYHQLTINEASYPVKEGMPELPVLSRMIAIPRQGKVEIEVLGSRTSTMQNIQPLPVQSDKSGPRQFSIDKEYYRGDKLTTSQPLQFSEPQIIRDLRVITLQIEPFTWDPTSKELLVQDEITLRINYSDEPGVNELTAFHRISSAFDKIYQAQVMNYEDYRSPILANIPPRIVMLHGENNDPVFKMVVDNFALWKRQKGADVTLLSTSVTGSSNTAIKSYLQGLYDNPQTRFDYLVIIGDVTGTFSVPAWSTENGFGDYPYQMLAGNDQLGDVFIGRISAENTTQLVVILSKIYAYEKDIEVQNAEHLNRMLLVADTAVSGISPRNLSYYIKEISQMENPDYSYTILAQHHPNPPDMNNAMNQGVGFFNFRGIGGMSGWSPSETSLQNINKLFHSIIITCNTGDYHMTATTEQMIRIGTSASPKGAVTSIGMWGNETATMPNNALCGGIYSGIFLYDMRTMGEAFLFTKLHFFELYGISNPVMHSKFTQWCNLMGDPTMEIFISIPNTFNISAPASVPAGVNSLDFIVLDQHNFPVANAAVTVTHTQGTEQNIVGRAYTDDMGRVYLPLDAEYSSTGLLLTVSKHDFKPLQQDLVVGDGSLLASAPIIDDDLQGESSGNGNGLPNSGETLEVVFNLRNTSLESIADVSGIISCDSPYVTIVDSALAFGNIPAGSNAASNSPVVLQISPQTPNNTLLRFVQTLEDSAGNLYTVGDYLSVSDAELSFVSYEISDAGNNVLDPGESAYLNLTVRNQGAVAVSDLVGELYSDNDMVSVLENLGSFGDAGINTPVSSVVNSFRIQGRENLLPGMLIPMRLKLSNPSGFLQWLYFSVSVGTVTVTDPLGPDKHGYVIYDDGDTDYEECPVYDWIEIAPAEGGSGTLLPIDDPELPTEGDDVNSNSLAWVDLPFTFRFYGVDYQDITVSSNGVISFGHTDNHEFRNYRIPGPMGPSPLIAAFWDDLSMDSNSQICTWYDAANHLFIIEWYKMMNGYDNSYLETFQVILYDPVHYPKSFGDGPIKIQYKVFNNVNSGATFQNHGNFCTIGIESPDQLDGLEYTFMNTYPAAASPLGHERAIYITKRPEYYDHPWLVVSDIVINDLNGTVEPGETVAMGVHLDNLGIQVADDVSAVLEIRDPFVSIINGSSEYHPIQGQGNGVNNSAFTFVVSPETPVGHILRFEIIVTNSYRTWSHNLEIEVKKSGMVYDGFYIHDSAGNGNGAADPGETISFVVNVSNTSQVTAVDLVGEISTTFLQVSFDNPAYTIAELAPGEVAQFVYQISISSEASINQTIPIAFNLSSANAFPVSELISLGCGSMGMNSDFESNPGGLSAQSGWEWGTSLQYNANSGEKVWATVLDGNYANGANYELISEPIFIGTNASLSFWHRMQCQQNFDGGNVSVSINNGASWILIYPSSGSPYTGTVYSMNEPGFASDIPDWTNASFDLSMFANSEILLRWHFTSDGSTTGYGWFIDDVTVTGYAIKAGSVSGSVTLSDEGDPSVTKLSVPLANRTFISNPTTTGDYTIYLPEGSYTLTAGQPYHISLSSPAFEIGDSAWEHNMDFHLIHLPGVSDISLDHDEEESSVTLNWTPPSEPPYPVLAYRVYRKTGPGLVQEIAELSGLSYSEDSIPTGTYYYHVHPLYAEGEGAPSDTLELQILPPTSSAEDQVSPTINALYPNSPNPFNPSTTISFDLAENTNASLKIYNLKGQLVSTLFRGFLNSGHHRLVWDGKDSNNRQVASGVYLYRLETGSFVQTRKMLMMK